MRFNDRALFVMDSTESYYDWEKGEEVQGETETNSIPCHISDLELEREKRVFGDYRAEHKVIYLQAPFTKSFTHIEINQKKYRVITTKQNNKVFYVEATSIEN